MKKTCVGVVMGGPSSEHGVSLKTGKMVLAALDKERFDSVPIVVTQKGRWFFGVSPEDISDQNKEQELETIPLYEQQKELTSIAKKIDVAFIAMHGEYGEDGTVQALFELTGVPYTGSGVLASALGMDKSRSLSLLRDRNYAVPSFCEINKLMWQENREQALSYVVERVSFPAIVKPVTGGSSIGMTIVENVRTLASAIDECLEYDSRAMIQVYVNGREVTCGVIDDGMANSQALEPTEIIPKASSFFDFDAKYIPGATEEITPPDLPRDMIEQIRKIARATHEIIGCSGMSRTDMIIEHCKVCNSTYEGCDEAHGIYILEINAIPGMTETSLLPQAAERVGISFTQLLGRIVVAAMTRCRLRNKNTIH